MTASASFESAFHELIGTLEALPFPYCLLGALALGAWGTPRTTQDLDALIQVRDQDRARLIEALTAKQFHLDRDWADQNPLVQSWHLRLHRGPIPVDLLLPRDEHDHTVLQRRHRLSLGALPLWVITPEDLILHKLKVGRPRDFEDVLSVLQRQGAALDRRYLDKWARSLGITEELAYCVDQSGDFSSE